MRYLLFCLFLVLSIALIFPGDVSAATTIWKIQAIDTMKYSRDEARNVDILDQIDTIVETIAGMGATHVSIATPYDEEFIPTLTAWVREARKQGISVWFRGNWSAWEGWFGYPKFTNPNDHHAKTTDFIAKHADLFLDGDIFSPAPEAENGGFGDPRGSAQKSAQYNRFLVDSYAACQKAFRSIGKKVSCGYFSMNGDVAKTVLTRETVEKTGNIVVIDHYVRDLTQIPKDIAYLYEKLGAPIVFGEFGAPIPDINGPMTEDEQATYIDQLYRIFYHEKDRVIGMNYWTVINGSAAILNPNGSSRKAVAVIRTYYIPAIVQGTITDIFSDPLPETTVNILQTPAKTVTDKLGSFQLPVPEGSYTLEIQKEGYHAVTRTVSIITGKTTTIGEQLNPKHRGILYYLRMMLLRIKIFMHR